jgi:hypothetical protein
MKAWIDLKEREENEAEEAGAASGAAIADARFEVAREDAVVFGHDEHIGDHPQV